MTALGEDEQAFNARYPFWQMYVESRRGGHASFGAFQSGKCRGFRAGEKGYCLPTGRATLALRKAGIGVPRQLLFAFWEAFQAWVLVDTLALGEEG